MDVAVVIPTLNAERELGTLLPSLLATMRGEQIWVVDSSSADGTVDVCRRWGVNVRTIDRADFNHSGTRKWARSLVRSDVIVYLTQDVALAGSNAISRLVEPLGDASIAVAYGRQLPRPGSCPLEAFPRLFNYPDRSVLKRMIDLQRLGIKAFFCSNSFCAYRTDAWDSAGGFPDRLLIWEDQHLAARLLLKGYTIAYVAEACVYHSHNYTLRDEFRRYFDTGAFLQREAWMRALGGEAEGEGIHLLLQQTAFLRETGQARLIPYSLLAAMAKYAGYRVGRLEPYLPRASKSRLSLQPYFW